MLQQSPHRHSPREGMFWAVGGESGPSTALFMGGAVGVIREAPGPESRRCRPILVPHPVTVPISYLSVPRFPLLDNEAMEQASG